MSRKLDLREGLHKGPVRAGDAWWDEDSGLIKALAKCPNCKKLEEDYVATFATPHDNPYWRQPCEACCEKSV